MTVATKARTAERTAKRAADSPWADRLARLGFCARGLVYMIVGAIALQIAFDTGSRDDEASKDGALREIAERPMGGVLLVVLAAGLAGYALWRASEALWGKGDEDDEAKRSAKRAGSAAKAVLYAGFCVSTVRFIANGPQPSNDGEQEQTLTARVLDWPAGQWLVGGLGIAVIGGGVYLAYRGLAQKFEKRLDTSEMGPVMGATVDVLGTVGMAAKGLVFGVAGFLLIKAALDFDPDEATGVDGTLRTIAQQAYGQVLLTVTALGLIAYGLYSFAEARYRRL
jgi:hypothetical protein